MVRLTFCRRKLKGPGALRTYFYCLPASLLTHHYSLLTYCAVAYYAWHPCSLRPWLLAILMCGGHTVGLGVALSLSMAALSDRRVIQHAGTPKLLKYSAVTCVYCMERQTDCRDQASISNPPIIKPPSCM